MNISILIVICALSFSAGMIFSAALIRRQEKKARARRQAFMRSCDGRTAAMRDMARAMERFVQSTIYVGYAAGTTIYKGNSNSAAESEFTNQLRKDLFNEDAINQKGRKEL